MSRSEWSGRSAAQGGSIEKEQTAMVTAVRRAFQFVRGRETVRKAGPSCPISEFHVLDQASVE